MAHEVQGTSEAMGGRSHEVLRGTHTEKKPSLSDYVMPAGVVGNRVCEKSLVG